MIGNDRKKRKASNHSQCKLGFSPCCSQLQGVVDTTDVSRTSLRGEGVGMPVFRLVRKLLGELVGRMEILLGSISLYTTTRI